MQNEKLSIVGKGGIILQNEIDEIKYEILKKKNEFQLNSTISILKNPFQLDLINYNKDEKSVLELNLNVKNVNNPYG